MPFEVKIRPVDFNPRCDEGVKTVAKSRFKRIFERQFTRVSSVSGNEEHISNKKDENDEFEPGSACLAKMVRSFMEQESPEKQRCGRSWCNCVNGECIDNSDDEFDSCSCFGDLNLSSSGDACENVKSLVPCVSLTERNLLADTARIIEQNKISKRKDDVFLKIVADGLSAIGYDASICNSHWEKSFSCPAGEYKYVDVITEGERLIIDIDFRSEFEIARPTKKYRTILQTLPAIFVGKSDRLQRIISVVMEAAKQSLKKKGMPFPPWRKVEYVKSKWLSAYCRTNTGKESQELPNPMKNISYDMKLEDQLMISEKYPESEPKLIFDEKSSPIVFEGRVIGGCSLTNNFDKNEKTLVEAQIEQQPITLKKSSGIKISGGLACIIEDMP
ncbi:hypothetical protein Leryth_016286 [Lithospermum erythrorhizon]|nr:hypothetical protein Leryth_016286 [Lithospermum erythrorhizon]